METEPIQVALLIPKREYFAGLALQALISRSSASAEYASRQAVKYADALILALNESN
jgi:uncharacterized membrane protein YfcA